MILFKSSCSICVRRRSGVFFWISHYNPLNLFKSSCFLCVERCVFFYIFLHNHLNLIKSRRSIWVKRGVFFRNFYHSPFILIKFSGFFWIKRVTWLSIWDCVRWNHFHISEAITTNITAWDTFNLILTSRLIICFGVHPY